MNCIRKMIYLFLGLNFLLLVSHNAFGQINIEPYSEALSILKKEAKIAKKSLKRGKFDVSSEVLFAKHFFIYFEKQVKLPIALMLKDTLVNTRIEPLLAKLGSSKKYNLKAFFTEIDDGFFCAEIIQVQPKSSEKYMDRINFGPSEIFLFKIQDGQVVLVESKIFQNN